MSPFSELTSRLKLEAIRLGFDAVGVAPAVAPPGYPDFLRWLEAGRAAGMGYMSRNQAARAHPSSMLEGVRSLVMVSLVYGRRRARDAAHDAQPGKSRSLRSRR